jgi:hypothetical protein
VPPEDFVVPRFAAEPPQGLPPGDGWEADLSAEFLRACLTLDADEVGAPGEVTLFPDRTWDGRTYVPVTAPTSAGWEVFGVVSYATDEKGYPFDLRATADATEDTAAENPDWQLDLSDEVVGGWRGEDGAVAAMTLVWGVPMVRGGAIVTAELGDVTVDQCRVAADRFTLLAPDAYRGDTLQVRLWSVRGEELAAESLYAEED